MILTTCAACAAPLAHDAPRCVRCNLIDARRLAARDEDDGVVEEPLRERARQGVLRVVGDDRVEALAALLPRHRGFFISL